MSESKLKKCSITELKKAHKFSFKNEASIKASNRCGCFYCLAIFNAEAISDSNMVTETDGLRTVICPECGVDAVLGDQSGFSVSVEFLSKMKLYFF